jgi:hypothetical protein
MWQLTFTATLFLWEECSGLVSPLVVIVRNVTATLNEDLQCIFTDNIITKGCKTMYSTYNVNIEARSCKLQWKSNKY